MDCETCNNLLAAYKHCARVLTNVGLCFRDVSGEDFPPALTELKRLRQVCRDADEALIAHWRQAHDL
jgi:hypothetical protein